MGCICNLGSGPEEKGGLESGLTSGGALFCKKLDILPLLLLFLPTVAQQSNSTILKRGLSRVWGCTQSRGRFTFIGHFYYYFYYVHSCQLLQLFATTPTTRANQRQRTGFH